MNGNVVIAKLNSQSNAFNELRNKNISKLGFELLNNSIDLNEAKSTLELLSIAVDYKLNDCKSLSESIISVLGLDDQNTMSYISLKGDKIKELSEQIVIDELKKAHWMCPHCNEEMKQNDLYYDGSNWYHRKCARSIKRPRIHMEGLPISVDKRMDRRKKTPTIDDPTNATDITKPGIKRQGDTDPRKTTKGRRSLKGSKKLNRDKDKKLHADEFREFGKEAIKENKYCSVIEFIKSHNNCSMDTLIENVAKLDNKYDLYVLFEKLSSHGNWYKCAFETMKCLLEGTGYDHEPHFAMADNADSIDKAHSMASNDAMKLNKIFKATWVECKPIRTNIVEYKACGASSWSDTKYVKALHDGIVRGFKLAKI